MRIEGITSSCGTSPDKDALYDGKNANTYLHEVLQMCNRVLQAGAVKDIWALSLQIK